MALFGQGVRQWVGSALTSLLETVAEAPTAAPSAPPMTASTALADELARARMALQEGRAQDVVNALEGSLEALTVRESATWSTLGTAYDRLGRPSDREKAYKRAVNLYQQAKARPDADDLIAILPALVFRGKRHEAIEALQAVAQQQPENVDVARTLAEQLDAAGEGRAAAAAYAELTRRLPADSAREAVEYLRRAVRLDSDDPEYEAEFGRALVATGDRDAGVARLRSAVTRLPADHGGRVWLAEALVASGQFEEGLKLADTVLVNRPDNAEALEVRGGALVGLHRVDEGIEAFDAAIAVPSLAPELSARIHVDRGEACLTVERYDDAITAFTTALSINPDEVSALIGRGKAYYGRDIFDRAKADFACAAKMAADRSDDSSRGQALALLGETLRLQEDYDGALKALDDALSIYPKSAFALATRGQVLSALGNQKEAIEFLAAAVDINPDLGWARASLAESYRLTGRLEQALAELHRVAASGGETSFTHSTRGQIFSSRGSTDEAIEEFQAAWSLNQSAGVADLLAKALSERGLAADIEKAIEVIDDVLEKSGEQRALLRRKADLLRLSGQSARALATIDEYLAGPSAREDDTAWATKASILIDLRRWREALQLSEQVLSRNETYTFASYAKVQAVTHLGDYEGALEEVNRVLSYRPNDGFTLKLKAALYCDLRRFDGALMILREDLADGEIDPLVNTLIGYSLRRLQPPDLENALRHLRLAAEDDASEAWYKIELADTLDESITGKSAEADELRHDVLANAPRQSASGPEDIALAGWAASGLGDFPDAAARLRSAIQMDPRIVSFRFALGLTLLEAGDDELGSADDEYEGAIRLVDREPNRERRDAIVVEALDDLHRALHSNRVHPSEQSDRIENLLFSGRRKNGPQKE